MYRYLVIEIYQTVGRLGPKVGRLLGATTCPTVQSDLQFSTVRV